MTIFVATPDAATIFNITADLAMTAVLDPAGGKVAGTDPRRTPLFRVGQLCRRSTAGCPTTCPADRSPAMPLSAGSISAGHLDLDTCDDTDDSANDFITAIPDPIKNNGTPGRRPRRPAATGRSKDSKAATTTTRMTATAAPRSARSSRSTSCRGPARGRHGSRCPIPTSTASSSRARSSGSNRPGPLSVPSTSS